MELRFFLQSSDVSNNFLAIPFMVASTGDGWAKVCNTREEVSCSMDAQSWHETFAHIKGWM